MKWKMLVGRDEAKDVTRADQEEAVRKIRSGIGRYYVYGVNVDRLGRGSDVFSYILVDGTIRFVSSTAVQDGCGGYLPHGASLMSEMGVPEDLASIELVATCVLDDNLGFLYLYEFEGFDDFMSAMADLDSRRAPYSSGSSLSFWREYSWQVKKIIETMSLKH